MNRRVERGHGRVSAAVPGSRTFYPRFRTQNSKNDAYEQPNVGGKRQERLVVVELVQGQGKNQPSREPRIDDRVLLDNIYPSL